MYLFYILPNILTFRELGLYFKVKMFCLKKLIYYSIPYDIIVVVC